MSGHPQNSTTDETPERLGVWLIGACGAVSTTTMVGTHAIRNDLQPPRGLVTEQPPFGELPVADLDALVFGGCDVTVPVPGQTMRELEETSGIFGRDLIEASSDFLDTISERIEPGIHPGSEEYVDQLSNEHTLSRTDSPMGQVENVRQQIQSFRQQNELDNVVVVNLASTEPSVSLPELREPEEYISVLKEADQSSSFRRTPSILYATAAVQESCPYVNFTPSPGASYEPIRNLALQNKVPHMGQDAKTGETLLKTVLAPMFMSRALKVLSWEGHNILGNQDGRTLRSEETREAKTRDKQEPLSRILSNNGLHSGVRIDYVPSLGDWKTAWDFVHFEGFLNTKMSLQLIWQGSDSALAAPLVLDLIRFADLAGRRNEKGPMTHLASYFKSPLGCEEHNFHRQFERLIEYTQDALGPEAAEIMADELKNIQ